MGTYQLGRRLVAASGVVEAHLGALDRDWLVVSRLSAPWSADGTFVERFAQHARGLEQVTSHDVAPLVEFGSGGDGLWFVERTSDGEPLRALMASKVGGLSVNESVAIVERAAEGLTALHRAGLVHGDVSASSLFVTSTGRVVLLHAGVAVVAGAHPGRGPARSEPHAIAPEQLGGPSTASTDVFRLGLLFLELLTGRSLFVASDPQHVLGLAQKYRGVPPSAFHGVPEQLQSMLGWMMQPSPSDRPSASEFSNVLNLASTALGLSTGTGDVAAAFRRLSPDRQPLLSGRTTELRLQPPRPPAPPPRVSPPTAPKPSAPGATRLGRIEPRRVTHEELEAARQRDATAPATEATARRELALGEQLVRNKKLTPVTLAASQQRALMLNLSLADTLLVDGVLGEDDVVEALAQVTRTAFVGAARLAALDGTNAPLHLLPKAEAERLVAVPLAEKGPVLVAAVIDPLDGALLEALKLASGRTIQPVRAGERALRDALARLYGGESDDPDAWLERGTGLEGSAPQREGAEALALPDESGELELEGRAAARTRSVTASGLDEGQTKLVELLLGGYQDAGREGIALIQLCGDVARRLNASTADVDKARFAAAALVTHNLSRGAPVFSVPPLTDFHTHLGPLALPVKALVPALFDGLKTMPEDVVDLAVVCSFVFCQLGESTCPTPWQPVLAAMRTRRLPSVALEALSRVLQG